MIGSGSGHRMCATVNRWFVCCPRTNSLAPETIREEAFCASGHQDRSTVDESVALDIIMEFHVLKAFQGFW